jgi:hypothetical protein
MIKKRTTSPSTGVPDMTGVYFKDRPGTPVPGNTAGPLYPNYGQSGLTMFGNLPISFTPPISTSVPAKATKKEKKGFTTEQAMAYGVANPKFREVTQDYLFNTKKGNKALTPAQLAQNAIQRGNEEINAGNFEAAANYFAAADKTAAKAGNAAINAALASGRERLGAMSPGTGTGTGTTDEMGPADIQDYLSRYGAVIQALGGEFNQAQIDEQENRAKYDPLVREAQRSQYYDRQRALGQLASSGLGFAPGLGAITSKAAGAPGAQAAASASAQKAAANRAIISNLINSISRYQTDLTDMDVENYRKQISNLNSMWSV